ncbi:IclR family transcriptional regulator [Alicyclobacillus acidoterrestris]|uniref:IclR family transcriptional regulator n=1 Tax=Alicyclobacillus acidoterrestris (strain ATCC 49025 / DSM 3922 / CIP 106132 / NCIMB 13137 / GD3B) TaxID=1356854 RepID=A0A9E6ZII6_ALIAG|nr:IclR family transcriptional regulator [Alicyclobacillus acidoterrestris]UNO47806.1 IclR family transcriptional regulator [Alicyclobacillus acidoterrestris]
MEGGFSISQNHTVVKSLEVLNLFLKEAHLNLNQMTDRLRQPKTSVYRMVRSLEEVGFLTRDEDGKYRLGLMLLQFGQLVSERLDVRRLALPVMERLRDDTDEAVNLIVRDGYEAVYIEKVNTMHPVRVYNERPGLRVPLYAGACPRILLTYMEKEEQEQYLLDVQLHAVGHATITDVGELRRVLDEAKERGYTISHSELLDGTSAVAAPIFNHRGEIVAGISVVGLTSRFTPEVIPDFIEKVKQAAEICSTQLGFQHQKQV